MRRIDKSDILSYEFKKWLDGLNRDNQSHPDKKTFYNDVVMNLLYCQKGVCAYSEMRLCTPEQIKKENWKGGRYHIKKPQRFGQLEHFDPGLKQQQYWQWENLFMASSRLNLMKGIREVDEILKPDSPPYDPMALLEYDEERNLFRPHSKVKDNGLKERIRRMIEILQINYDFVRHERKSYLEKVATYREVGRTLEIDRFYTACQMVETKRKEG